MFDENALKAVLRFEVEKASLAAAFVLAVALGVVGAHDFYLRRTAPGVIKVALTITGVGAIISLIWVVVDLLALPRRVRDSNRDLASKLFLDAREAASFV